MPHTEPHDTLRRLPRTGPHCRPLTALLAALLASCLLVLAACGSPSTAGGGAASPTASASLGTVSIETFPSTDSAWLEYIAAAKGLFQRNGITPQYVTAATGVQASAGLASGSMDVAIFDPPSAASLVATGLHITMIAAEIRTHWNLVAGSGAALPDLSRGFPYSLQDLKGKSIGVLGVGTSSYFFLEALLRAAGMSNSDVNIVSTGGTLQELGGVETGQLAAAIEEPTSTYILTKTKGAHIIYSFGHAAAGVSKYPALASITGIPWAGFWSPTSWVTAHPAVVHALQLSFMEADAWAHDPKNFSALVSLLTPRLPAASPGTQAQIVRYVLPYLESYYTLTEAQTWMNFALTYKLISKPISGKTWLDTSIPSSASAVTRALSAAGFRA